MNTLEEKFSDAIYNAEQDYEEYKFEVGAKSCTAIAIDFAKGFGEWVSSNGWLKMKDKSEWVKIGGHGMPMSTTDQLINLYIESIKQNYGRFKNPNKKKRNF